MRVLFAHDEGGGRMIVPNRPGLGFTLSDQALAWVTDSVEFGRK